MKRLSVFVVLSLLLVACGSGGNNGASAPEAEVVQPTAPVAVDTTADTAAFPVTITHDRGETTLEQPAERVVVMSEEFIELAIALDLAPVGVGPWRNEPTGETFTTLPHIEQPVPGEPTYLNGSEPNMEAILALQPDLILHHDSPADENDLYGSFSQIAPTLAYFVADVDGWKSAIRGLGTATGYSARAEEVISDYDQRVAELQAEMAPVVGKAPEVTLLIATPGGIGIFDERMVLGSLLGSLGFTLSVPDSVEILESGMAPISPEALGEISTDTIIKMGWENSEEDVSAEILSSLDIPTLNVTVISGMGFAGPFASITHLESFANAFNEEYVSDDAASTDINEGR